MKKQFSVAAAALIAMSTLGSGCKTLTTDGMANAASQDLGIPVFLWALDGDVCASRQMKALFDEFSTRNGNTRAALSDQFRKTYQAVVVLATKDLGDMTGELKVVQLQDRNHRVINAKTVVDTRATPAHDVPGTVIDRGDASAVEGKVLSLRPKHAEDKSHKELYFTTDSAMFDVLPAYNAPGAETGALLLSEELSQGHLTKLTQGFSDADPCGKFAGINDLL